MPSALFDRKPAFGGAGARRSGNRRGHVPDIETFKFKYGTINYPEPQEIPRGAASNALNFITRGTKIETRPGYAPYGPEVSGSSKAFVFTAHKWDGTEIVFKASGNSLFYDSDGAGTWVEVGTNILAGNGGELISFEEYSSPAGAQLWVSSTNSDLIKILTANPGSYKSQYDTTKNFKATIRIKKSRMFSWNYLGTTLGKATKNTIQGSYIDAQTYTTVTAEALANGDGVTKTYAGTLAAVTGKRTCFGVVITDGTETFTDNYIGGLTGSLGGTGTINYTTGAYSVTFNTAPGNPITGTYQWEDSTNNGIADFTHSATRTAGQGFALAQNVGGDIKTMETINGLEYVIHERNAWVVTIPTDDVTIAQDIFRARLGLSSNQGAVATADGIYYVDTTRKAYISLLTLDPVSSLVLPRDISSSILDLSSFLFDQCVAFEFDVFILFACRTPDSTVNNRIIALNREISGNNGIYVYDIHDYYARSFSIKAGALLAGDSITATVYNLFANYDDNGAIANCFWEGNVDDYGTNTLKKARRFWFEGEIDINQSTDVLISTDRGGYVKIGTISGTGAYVDRSQAVLIGSLVIGYYTVGGGSNGKTSFHYICEIRTRLGKYQSRKVRFAPQGIGYFSVSKITDKDLVFHQDKLPTRYRAPR